ncbi:hypothetical protein LZ009_02930 [Ramlibacter sp. XY19]|uniref:hypothetical protein n=1 Tax=Ramlibacter paludis TaxID=2908000 RepID=UPI0023DC29F5|nr:hypothetical protein [Ramlibacter paludis]MCG2591727.1 hypothetical protein [Ramlibacter paludis]
MFLPSQAQRPARRPASMGGVLVLFGALFAFAGLYALLCLGLGERMLVVTLVIGFGLPVFLWLAMEWVAPPLVAALAGSSARYFPLCSLLLGIPLVLVYTFVSPVAMGGSSDFSVPLPWLSVPKVRAKGLQDLLLWRAQMWLAVYAAVFLLAYVSRFVRPPLRPGPGDDAAQGSALQESLRRQAENKRILRGAKPR